MPAFHFALEGRALSNQFWIGIDVSKAHLDVCALAVDKSQVNKQFVNDPAGIAALIVWANGLGQIAAFGMESTGGYELALAKAAFAAGLPVSVSNPRRVRDLARALNSLNKTDRADARVIAFYLQKVGAALWRPKSPLAAELTALSRRRGELVTEINRLFNQINSPRTLPKVVEEQYRTSLAQAKVWIEAIDEAQRQLIEQNDELRDQRSALVNIKGIGIVTASLILSEAGPVSDYESAKAYAAAAGLHPLRRESGAWRGKSSITKTGNKRLRSGIFLAASVAARYDPRLKAFKERLLKAGKTKMQALIACMRKLLMICYGILKAIEKGKTPFYN